MKNVIKSVVQWISTFLIGYCLASTLFILLFHTPVLKHMKVLMYRGVGLLILSTLFLAVLLAIVRKFVYRKLGAKDIVTMCILYGCMNMVLFTLIPVTVERSISVYMLSYMSDHQEETFTEKEIQEVFIKEYVQEFGAFQKRFEEQDVTGSIEQEEDGYKITQRGERLVDLFRLIAKLFNTDRRLLGGTE